MRNTLFLTFLSFALGFEVFTSPAALAGSPYTNYMATLLSGCPTFGSSTQDALSMIARSRQLIEELSKDPACQGLAPSMNSLDALTVQVGRLTRNQSKEAEVIQAQSAVEALSLLANSLSLNSTTDTTMLPLIAQTLAQARVSLALSTARITNESYSASLRKYATIPDIQSALMQLGAQLPKIEQCSTHKPNLFVDIVASLLPTVAAVGSPAFGVAATSAASLIKTLGKYASERRYTRRIKELDTIQKMASVHCALEMIQFSHCNADDGYQLVEWIATQGRNVPLSPHWKGYDILVTGLPKLTEWIQKLQLGRPPHREVESIFNSDTIKIESFYRSRKGDIEAFINEAVKEVGSQADQKKVGLELLKKITNRIIPPQYNFGGDGEFPKINVFLRVKGEKELPFFLVGKTPAELHYTNPAVSPVDWILTMSELLSADLVNIISERFREVIHGSDSDPKGTEEILRQILTNRRVVDAANLLLEATKPRQKGLSPYLVFYDIQLWLENLIQAKEHIRKAFVDYPNIDRRVEEVITRATNTKTKVEDVLKRIDDPENEKENTPEKKVQDISKTLNVTESGDRFLVERISNFVQIQLYAEVDSTQTDEGIQAILNASKQELVEKLTGFGTRPLDDVHDELEQTKSIHSQHLMQLWEFFQKDILTQLKDPSQVKLKNLYCSRILGTPNLSEKAIALCKGAELKSIYLNVNTPETWKSRLQLKFDEYAHLKPEDRACAYRKYRRNTYLYEALRTSRKSYLKR